MAISTLSKPHRLNYLNSFVLALVNGDVNRKVLIPNFIGLKNVSQFLRA
jgi:hypothetical protein